MHSGVLRPMRNALRPSLAEVTLVAVTSVAMAATVRAIEKSAEQACFGRILLLSDQPPARNLASTRSLFEWRKIQKISSRNEYSRFMLDHLADHIETRFALVVQWDGYVINGEGWKNEFLDYDYIGAPWTHFHDKHTVGNGGFSLRSKRLLLASRGLPLGHNEAEDVAIARTFRTKLEKQYGLQFAPETLARLFAYERTAKVGKEFGFHGVFNMLRDVPKGEFASILSTLEPKLLGRRESNEILLGALQRLDFWTVAQALRQRKFLKR